MPGALQYLRAIAHRPHLVACHLARAIAGLETVCTRGVGADGEHLVTGGRAGSIGRLASMCMCVLSIALWDDCVARDSAKPTRRLAGRALGAYASGDDLVAGDLARSLGWLADRCALIGV